MGADSPWIQLAGFIVAILGLAWTIFKHISSVADRLQTEIRGAERTMDAKLEATKEHESKARHTLSQTMQIAVQGIERDVKALGADLTTQIRQLERDTVRKADLIATETRIVGHFEKLERRFEQMIDNRKPARTTDA